MSTDAMLKNEFKTIILPMYKKLYPKSPLPTELEVWEGDQLDGGAVEGMVYVYSGVGKQLRAIRLYALAHESGHVATVEQGKGLGLGNHIPAPEEYKKSEHLADLIAMHTIRRCDPLLAKTIQGYFTTIKDLLGAADDMHPSGEKRVGLMSEYMMGAGIPAVTAGPVDIKAAEGATKCFNQIFTRTWNANSVD